MGNLAHPGLLVLFPVWVLCEANGNSEPVSLINPKCSNSPLGMSICGSGWWRSTHTKIEILHPVWLPGTRGRWEKVDFLRPIPGFIYSMGSRSLDWLPQNYLRSLLEALMPRFHSQGSGYQPWLHVSITKEAFKKQNGWVGVWWTECLCPPEIYMLKANLSPYVIILGGGALGR